MDYSKLLEVCMQTAENRHARRLAWAAIGVAGLWASAQIINSVAALIAAL